MEKQLYQTPYNPATKDPSADWVQQKIQPKQSTQQEVESSQLYKAKILYSTTGLK